MRLIFFGDAVGKNGRTALKKYYSELQTKYRFDIAILNGENVTHGSGLTYKHYLELLELGIDVITMGNHFLAKSEIRGYIDQAERLVRPLNFPLATPLGVGSKVFNIKGFTFRVSNVLGHLATMKKSFQTELPYVQLKQVVDHNVTPIHIVDVHAQFTSEKLGLAHYFSRTISAMLGTHTHVQTNDEQIISQHLGYISDVGMCGLADGIIGVAKQAAISRVVLNIPAVSDFETAGPLQINAVILDFDESSGACTHIEKVRIVEEY